MYKYYFFNVLIEQFYRWIEPKTKVKHDNDDFEKDFMENFY